VARPKSEDKRSAILAAATRVIASQGLSAPTAVVAKEAGVSNGSLFTYFETKADLLNQLYVELKTEMAAASLDGLPTESDIRTQMRHVWFGSLQWATSWPQKRRTLAHLAVSDDITPQSREIGHRTMAGVAKLLEQSRAEGPMRDVPIALVATLMTGVADAVVDFIIRDPANAQKHCADSFDAMWRMIA